MKKILFVLACLCACGSANAQTAPSAPVSFSVPGVAGSLDLTSLIKSLHPVYVFDQHKDSLAGACVHAVQFHSESGIVWVDINAGVVWRTTDGIGGPMVNAGVRFDNFWANANSTSWAQKHVTAIKLPQFEAGPLVAYVPRLGPLYGGFASLAW